MQKTRQAGAVNLGSKISNEYIEIVLADVPISPDKLDNAAARDNAARRPDEAFEDGEFSACQIQSLTRTNCLVLFSVEKEIRKAHLSRIFCRGRTRARTDTCEENLEIEGLCQVVIGSRIQALDDVFGRIPCRKKQDRRSYLLHAEALGHLESIEDREHDIEEDDIERMYLCLAQPRAAVEADSYDAALVFQALSNKSGKVLVVFDEKHVQCGFECFNHAHFLNLSH